MSGDFRNNVEVRIILVGAHMSANRNPLEHFDQSSFMIDSYTKFDEESDNLGCYLRKCNRDDETTLFYILLQSNPLHAKIPIF